MPLKQCEEGGKKGWQWGDSGACYLFTAGDEASEKAAKQKAIKQALAANGGKPPPEGFSEEERADFAAAGMKTCSNCNKTKSVDSFPEDGRTSDGYAAVCANCRFSSQMSEREFADLLQTVDIHDVPLLSTGGPYMGNGSPDKGDYFNPEQLQVLASNNQALAHEVRVPIKIGHGRSQKMLRNSGLFTDEMPAGGWVENIRFRGNDGKLIGDLKRVPRKLAELIRVGAFRTRSVELSKVTSQTHGGKEYDSVVTGLALLGAKAPAVRTLDDVWALYSDRDPDPPRFSDGIAATPVEYHTYAGTEALEIPSEVTIAVTGTVPTGKELAERFKVELARVKESQAAADTKGMSDNPTPVVTPITEGMNDEQIAKFAEAFGIEEADAKARRDKVLEKFSEFAASMQTPPDPPTPPTPDPTPTPDPAPAPEALAQVTALSERIETMETNAKKARVLANVNAAISTKRILPADKQRWVDFAMKEEDLAIDQLVAMPVRTDLLFAQGDDTDPATQTQFAQAGEAFYEAYANMTGVPRHAREGSAA